MVPALLQHSSHRRPSVRPGGASSQHCIRISGSVAAAAGHDCSSASSTNPHTAASLSTSGAWVVSFPTIRGRLRRLRCTESHGAPVGQAARPRQAGTTMAAFGSFSFRHSEGTIVAVRCTVECHPPGRLDAVSQYAAVLPATSVKRSLAASNSHSRTKTYGRE